MENLQMEDGRRNWIFHLAIPVRDLLEAERFYAGFLGCLVARRYDDRITLEFFGDQVVCHLNPEGTARAPQLYPRHFGVTFRKLEDFDALHRLALTRPEYIFRDRFMRFEGHREEHLSLCLIDPSNNVLEFKHYRDPEMMY